MDERLKREGIKSHKQRVEEYNKYLSNLSEHHDMYGFWSGCGVGCADVWFIGLVSDRANTGEMGKRGERSGGILLLFVGVIVCYV